MSILRRFSQLSITAKVFFLLLPLASVPPLAVMAQWYFVTRGEMEEEIKRSLEARWRLVETEVTEFLRDSRSRVREISESPLFQDLHGYLEYGLREEATNTQNKIHDFLVRVASRERRFQRICLRYLPHDQGIKILQGKTNSNDASYRTTCPPPAPDQPTQISEQILKGDGEIKSNFIRIEAPLLNPWGRTWARLAFDIPFTELSHLLARLPLPDEGAGIIVNHEGKPVACAQGVEAEKRGELCAQIGKLDKKTFENANNLRYPVATTHHDFVILSRKLSGPAFDWTLALFVTNEAYGATKRRMGLSSSIAGGMFFVVALCALLPLSRRLTAPLRRLEESARKIAEGDFQFKIPVPSQDEIGRLALAFNFMAKSLATREEQLQQQAASLVARNEELNALNRVLGKATTSLDLEQLLPNLLDEILSVMNLKVGAIRLVDENENLLKIVAHRGFSDEYMRSPELIRLSEGLTGKVATTGQPVFFKDAEAEPQARKLLNRTNPQWGPLRCFAAVPIRAQDKIVGVLSMGATGDRTFEETDLSSLLSIGLGIGACIENARLYHDLESAYQRLQTFHDHLLRAEKLSAMGELVAGVAHEINNPITAILGFSQLIRNKLAGTPQEEWAKIIVEQAGRCGKIVEQLLAFARETEKQEEILDVAEIMRDSLNPARMSLSLNSIAVELKMKKGECFVRGDRYQLQQVLLNLITNAQHALEDKEGERLLKVDVYPEGDQCIVQVTDNGKGIPPEVLQRVFDPFFTTKPIGKGTGLGLSLSYGIVKEHGGEITIQSRSGEGTTLKISLPHTLVDTPPPSEDHSLSGQTPELQGLRVLIIEDEEAIRDYLQEAFNTIGVKMLSAGSVKEARQMICEQSPDLILADIRLPDGDGFSLFAEVVAQKLVSPTRFAFMSGDTMTENTRKRLDELERPHIRKPFNIEEMRQFLLACVKEERRQRHVNLDLQSQPTKRAT